MKSILVASLVASASAFAPSSRAAPSSALSASMDKMSGSIDFMGKPYKFDPLKLSETYEPLVPFFREAELKHCRTAMLAVVGWIVTDLGVRFPGETFSVANVPSAKDAHDLLLTGPMVFMLIAYGLFELCATGPGAAASMRGEREPGDYGWDWQAPKDPAAYQKKVDQELLNGRLAMFAFGGIATQSVISGHGFPYI